MEELEYKNIEVVILFLQKLEIMNEHERKVLIHTIELLNNPMFVTNP